MVGIALRFCSIRLPTSRICCGHRDFAHSKIHLTTTCQDTSSSHPRFNDSLSLQSIQNSLEQVQSSLAQLPLYGTLPLSWCTNQWVDNVSEILKTRFAGAGSREVLFVVSALSTCDPGNVHNAINAAKNAKIRVSVVAVAAEMVWQPRMLPSVVLGLTSRVPHKNKLSTCKS
jgi:hypothetical protein